MGLTEDQFAHVRTYGEVEKCRQSGQYRNLSTGASMVLNQGQAFPEDRWVFATDIPAPR